MPEAQPILVHNVFVCFYCVFLLCFCINPKSWFCLLFDLGLSSSVLKEEIQVKEDHAFV